MRSVRAELLSSTGWFGSIHASEFEAELTRRSALRLSESRERASPLGRSLAAAAMPSVGMRRTTRVFGVVKGADGARVLRSGRRLWPDSAEGKLRKHSDGEDWYKMVKNGGGGGGGGDRGILAESTGWTPSGNSKPKKSPPAPPPVVEIEAPKPEPEDSEVKEGRSRDKLFGIVYVRKRKGLREGREAGKMVGGLLGRRKRRRLNSGAGFAVSDGSPLPLGLEPRKVVNDVAGSSSLARNYFVAQFLWTVLVYMTRAKLRLSDLFAFLTSGPISCINSSSSGISIYLDHPLPRRFPSCKIFGAEKFVPFFSVDFSAVPLCFMNMYLDMLFQHRRQLCLQNKATAISKESEAEVLESGARTTDANIIDNGCVSNLSIKGSKSICRSSQYRSGLISRGIQKRRSSLRRKRARNPSMGGVQKPNGLVSDLVSFRKNAGSLSEMTNNKIRRSLRSNSGRILKEVSSRMDGLSQDKDSTSCCANTLVIGSDKCYREEGANIILDMSPIGEWVIAVKKDGSTKFTHKAEKVMKPFTTNRYTHAVIWTAGNGWKLEFPNRKDWTIFKDLYKECADRNVPMPGVKSIPIPGINEVSELGDGHTNVFRRPDSYISVKDDEFHRAIARKTPSYDMDSEDELWLKKFNSDSENENHVLENNFELMVDAFEKAACCSEFDPSEEKPPADLGLQLGSRNAIDAVYTYWTKKRKQKQSPLLRVFQSQPARKPSLIVKPFALFRKKRSFKRQPSHAGRGKQGFKQGLAVVRDTVVEEHNSKLRVDDAKMSAKRSVESAVCKRQHAQKLMNNADLATFKAAMALRIAEGAASSASLAVVAEHLLD